MMKGKKDLSIRKVGADKEELSRAERDSDSYAEHAAKQIDQSVIP